MPGTSSTLNTNAEAFYPSNSANVSQNTNYHAGPSYNQTQLPITMQPQTGNLHNPELFAGKYLFMTKSSRKH